MPSMNFLLSGHDALSHIFDQIGDRADRLHRRLSAAQTNSSTAINRFARNTRTAMAGLQRDTDAGGKALEELGKVTKLIAPAAIPAAASLAPIAAGAGTVALAVGLMTAAMGPQISALGEAADAQKAFDDAVAKSGARSEEAVKKQAESLAMLEQLPPETRRAAVALGILKDSYQDWSDSLAGDTMAPVTKGLGLVNALLPKTKGLVKAAAGETDRLVTIIGGEMASPGLDRLNGKFTTFAQKTLRGVTDGIVHLLRLQDSGEGGGGKTREFLDWARAQGPTVASVLQSVATALLHLLDGASGVGVGLLQVVDVLAHLVSAVPPGMVATFLQLAIALKLTKAAALGMAAVKSALAGVGTQLVAMNTAAAATPGRLAAIRAGILALSRTTKIAMAGTGIGLALLALTELSQRSKHVPPDVDKLTDSLRRLGSTGQVTGEAAKAFGSDLDGLYGKVRSLTDPTTTDKIQQFLVGWTGWDSTPVADAKADLDSVDKSLADLVKGGDADLAAAAVKRLTAEYGKGGRDTAKFTSELNDYKSAIADAKFEQQLAADSMGLFGTQAQTVQGKLDAQKQSADGLRQSIVALNDVNRSALGGMIGFEASIDAAAKAAKENAGSLRMVGGELDVNSPKAQAAATALSDLAAKTDEATTKALEAGKPWEKVNATYSRGRDKLVEYAKQMGLSSTEAEAFAKSVLQIPTEKELRLQMQQEDATRDLEAFNAAIKKTPGAKKVTLGALTKAGEQVLESFGLKVKRLPDGRVTVTAKTGAALTGVQNVAAAVAALKGKAITVTTNQITRFSSVGSKGSSVPVAKRAYAAGGTPRAGEVALVGEEGPELVLFGADARVFDANRTKTALRGSAGARTVSAGAAAGQGLIAGMTAARRGVGAAARAMAAEIETGIRDEMQIASPSKKTKALAADIGKGLVVGLTGTQAKIKSVSKDLVKDIRTAFSGKKESSLVRYVDQTTAKLLAAAKKRDAITAKIAEARKFASDLTSSAREGASLGSLGIEADAVSAGTIKGGLAEKLAQIKQFTKYVDILAKRGLNKSLLRQILNMGPEQGYAYASALVGADKGTFTQINSLETQINKSTDALGKHGADAMYDSGKNASKGFLTGLLSEEKNLEKAMTKLATSMQKALRRALGIKSPATKVKPDGINTARGVAVGLLAGLPYIDRAMDTMAGRIAGRAAIAPTAGRPAFAGGGGGTVYNVHVEVHDAMDPLAVGREFQRILLEFGRAQGAGVQLKVG